MAKKRVTTKRTAPPKATLSKKEIIENILKGTKAGEKEGSKIPVSDRVGPAKTKKLAEDKYVRISEDSDIEKFKEMSQRVQNGSLQWAFYAVDGEKGYHYYLVK